MIERTWALAESKRKCACLFLGSLNLCYQFSFICSKCIKWSFTLLCLVYFSDYTFGRGLHLPTNNSAAKIFSRLLAYYALRPMFILFGYICLSQYELVAVQFQSFGHHKSGVKHNIFMGKVHENWPKPKCIQFFSYNTKKSIDTFKW